MRVEHEGGASTWLVETLVAPSVQGHWLPPLQELGPIGVFFRASCIWQSEELFGQSFSIALPFQALRGLPCLGPFSVVWSVRHRAGGPLAGVLLCSSVHQSLKGAPWVGPTLVQCVKHLMVQPLYCSAAEAGVWGERGYGGGSTPYVWLSSIALLPWLPGFPPQAFPTTFCSLITLPSVSPHSTAALALELIHIPQTLASSRCTFQGTCIPVQDMYGCSKDCLILIPFRLP